MGWWVMLIGPLQTTGNATANFVATMVKAERHEFGANHFSSFSYFSPLSTLLPNV